MFYLVIMQNDETQAVFRYDTLDAALAAFHTELDSIIETQKQQSARIDAHNHLNERITRLEVLAEEANKK